MASSIHPTAIIHDGVELGVDINVGPYSQIFPGCRIGDRAWLGSHTIVGEDPQWFGVTMESPGTGKRKFHGVNLGEDVVIREACRIYSGVDSATQILAGTQLMAGTHIGHDCKIGAFVRVATRVTLLGYVTIGSRSYLGAASTFRQGVTVGAGAVVGMGSVVLEHVSSMSEVVGNPARFHGLNHRLLDFLNVDSHKRTALRDIYSRHGGHLESALGESLEEEMNRLVAELNGHEIFPGQMLPYARNQH